MVFFCKPIRNHSNSAYSSGRSSKRYFFHPILRSKIDKYPSSSVSKRLKMFLRLIYLFLQIFLFIFSIDISFLIISFINLKKCFLVSNSISSRHLILLFFYILEYAVLKTSKIEQKSLKSSFPSFLEYLLNKVKT